MPRGLSEKELELLLIEITNEQAENSEIGGDSDAEDDELLDSSCSTPSTRSSSQVGNSTPTLPTWPSSSKASPNNIPSCSTPVQSIRTRPRKKRSPFREVSNEWQEDSDDSVKDPDFYANACKTRKVDELSSSDDEYVDILPKNRDTSRYCRHLEEQEDEGNEEDEENGDDENFKEREEKSEEREEEPELKNKKLKTTNQPFTWTKTSCKPAKYPKINFNQHFGTNQPLPTSSPLGIVSTILTVSILNHIVLESNLYANQRGKDLDLTLEELKAFLGIIIIMGFHCLPSIKLYWSNDENFHVERVARVMSLKRFLKILRYLHINNNENMPKRDSPNYDKLYKIRPLLTHLQKMFSTLFSPSRFLSIDESMIAFKGRSTMKQYMPLKPIKRGFKVWVCCCAVTGFMLQFEVYTGKSSDGSVKTNLGEYVVTALSKSFEGLFYCLFFDNFFTSLQLIRRLLEKGLFACGTFRVDRKFYPKELFKKKYEKGDIEFVQSEDISITRWKDHGKQPVTVVSNMHDPSDTALVDRTNNKGERDRVVCPQTIADYNAHMGGVDKFDQIMSYYCISQKSKRWWIKLFYYFIECALVNSYIMYKTELKNKTEKPMAHLTFRSILANELIGTFCSRKRKGYAPGRSYGRTDLMVTKRYKTLFDFMMSGLTSRKLFEPIADVHIVARK